jgi:hypothetical protein
MDKPAKPRGFPAPSSLRVIPGTERAQAAYPYYVQFSEADDDRFWFYNSMHFPEPMSAFDMVTAEAAYCALGAANTRVHCLPTTLGIDHRIINGRVYIGGNAVTDPAEIARRTEEFQKRAFYYYENWERLYEQWRKKMLTLIGDAEALPKVELPDLEPIAHVHAGRGVASNHYLLDIYHKTLEGYFRMWHHHFEFLLLGYGAYMTFFAFCKKAFPEITTRPSLAWSRASRRRSSARTMRCGGSRGARWSSAWIRRSRKARRSRRSSAHCEVRASRAASGSRSSRRRGIPGSTSTSGTASITIIAPGTTTSRWPSPAFPST